MNLDALNWDNLIAAIFLWFVTSLIIEEASKAVFDWKIFKDNFAGKGLKTPIVFVESVLVCVYFKIDILLALLGAVGITGQSNWVSTGVSALLLTGGSSSVFRMLNRLREAKTQISGGST